MASTYTEKGLKYLDTTPKSGQSIPSNEKTNATTICKSLKNAGYTKAGAQAVLSNIDRESSFNPKSLENVRKSAGYSASKSIGGKGGYGLIQWTASRRRGLEKAANLSSTTRDDLNFQIRYLVSEKKGKKIAGILKSETNPVIGCLEYLFLDVRSGSAIRFRDAVKADQIPGNDEIKRVQRRVDSLWRVQPIVDEVYGGSIKDYPTGNLPTTEGTGNSANSSPNSATSTDPNKVNQVSNAKQSSTSIPASKKLPIYTIDSFTRSQAQHFKKTLNGFVAFRIDSLEEKDTGTFDNDDLNEYWMPLYVILDIYNQYISLLDATGEPEKGSNTPGRKLTEFYTGYQDEDTSKKEYQKKCKFLTNEMHFSIDPLVCILPKPVNNTKLYDSKKLVVPWRDPMLGYDTTSYAPGLVWKNGFHKNVVEALDRGLMRGGTDDILNILISGQLLQQELDKIVDSNKDSDQNEGNDMVTFLNIILKASNEALGGINDLETIYDEQDDMFYIVDRKVTPALRNILPTISLSGIRSTITKLNISSKISSKIGSMISIAAQGTGGHTKDNIAPLLEWNRGLLDRHIIHKTQKNTEDNKQVKENRETPEDERLKKWTLAYYEYWQEFNGENNFDNGDYDRAAVANMKGYHKEWCQKWVVEKRSKSQDNPLPAPGVIPVELSFTTMGIGGLKIGQAFLIEEGILPFQYSENFGFIITGLSHNISDGKWTTDVKTQFYSTRPPTPEEIAFFNEKHNSEGAPYQNTNSSSPTSGGRSGGVTTSSPGNPSDITGKTITSGFPLRSNCWSNVKINKTQVMIHWTAGNQTSDKGKGTIDTLNKRGVSYHYIIDASGHVESVVPETSRAYHAGGKKDPSKRISANTNSIGISLKNLGYCKSESTSSYGKVPNSQLKCVRLVDHDGNNTKIRGQKWNQEVTDAQLVALESLLKGIKQRNPGIPGYKWEGKSTYDQFFPPKSKFSYEKNKPGYYSHCSSNKGKVDMLPTPKIVNFLKKLKI